MDLMVFMCVWYSHRGGTVAEYYKQRGIIRYGSMLVYVEKLKSLNLSNFLYSLFLFACIDFIF